MKTFKVKYQARDGWGDVIKSGTYRVEADNVELSRYRVEVGIKKQYPKVRTVEILEVKEHIDWFTRFVLWLNE